MRVWIYGCTDSLLLMCVYLQAHVWTTSTNVDEQMLMEGEHSVWAQMHSGYSFGLRMHVNVLAHDKCTNEVNARISAHGCMYTCQACNDWTMMLYKTRTQFSS